MKGIEGDNVDGTFFKQIVGSLMYFTATWPDIMHVATCKPFQQVHGES